MFTSDVVEAVFDELERRELDPLVHSFVLAAIPQVGRSSSPKIVRGEIGGGAVTFRYAVDDLDGSFVFTDRGKELG